MDQLNILKLELARLSDDDFGISHYIQAKSFITELLNNR